MFPQVPNSNANKRWTLAQNSHGQSEIWVRRNVALHRYGIKNIKCLINSMIIQITFSEVAIKPLNHNSIFAYAGKKVLLLRKNDQSCSATNNAQIISVCKRLLFLFFFFWKIDAFISKELFTNNNISLYRWHDGTTAINEKNITKQKSTIIQW